MPFDHVLHEGDTLPEDGSSDDCVWRTGADVQLLDRSGKAGGIVSVQFQDAPAARGPAIALPVQIENVLRVTECLLPFMSTIAPWFERP